MEVVTTVAELRRLRRELAVAYHDKNFERPVVGLVPTMGALHRGHVSLIQRMVAECDVAIVTVFVNPSQFGAGEDYTEYPRVLDEDLRLCRQAGAHIVFAPENDEVYPPGYATSVRVAGLTERWCGATRPGHFDGVTTVVAKLLGVCRPDRAYFGEKDFQQLQVVRRMVADLNIEVEIAGCTTVREEDGLAMSSRNAYLSDAERSEASRLFFGLKVMAACFNGGVRDAASLVVEGRHAIEDTKGVKPQVEYLAVVDPLTLEQREQAQVGDRIMVAARLGATRLIDNLELTGRE